MRWAILHGYGALRLPGLIGSSDAMRLLLTGSFVDAAEALRIGLVSEMTAPGDLQSTARAIADQIAANGPAAIRMTKELALRGREMSLADGLRLYQEYTRSAFASPGRKRGPAGLRRAPRPHLRQLRGWAGRRSRCPSGIGTIRHRWD